MKKKKKPQQFIQKPTYDGGSKAMLAFIGKSLKYPQEAFQKKVEGTVRLRIRINYKGVVESSKVISGIGYGCSEEAQRVAGLLKFKVPTNRGLKAHFHKMINFHFRLPKPQKEGVKQLLQYEISKKKTEKETVSNSEKGYKYRISY